MTWTYTGDPANVPLDAVRLTIGDTESSDPQLDDEVLEWLLVETEDDAHSAARRAVDFLISKYARAVDRSVGDVKVSASQRLKGYEQLAQRLDRAAGAGVDVPSLFTGSGRNPEFYLGMHDA